MKIAHEVNLSALAMAVVAVVGGVDIIYTGKIWNIVLGEERNYVGTVSVIAGVYFFFLAFKRKRNR